MTNSRRRRRARQLLITAAITAFVGAATATAATASPTSRSQGSTNAKVAPSLVRVTVRGRRSGPGLVVRADGYVLTAADVVSADDGDTAIDVTTSNGDRASARVVGTRGRLTVLRIEDGRGTAPSLDAATFARSVSPAQLVAPGAGALLDANGDVAGWASGDITVPADAAVRIVVELIAADSGRPAPTR